MNDLFISGLFYGPSNGSFFELLLWLALVAVVLYVAFYALVFIVAIIQLIIKGIRNIIGYIAERRNSR